MPRSPFLAMSLVATLAATAGTANAEPAVAETTANIGVTAGAGVAGFTDDQTNDVLETGGMWEVRGIFGVSSPIALEAAYIGTAHAVNLPVGDVDVIGNGLEAAVRLNLGTFLVQPYVVGGVGWMHYDLRVGDMEVDMPTDDDIATVPAGAGVSFYAGPALIDVRASYRLAFDDELVRDEGDVESRESLDTWSATARVGLTF